MLGLADVVVLAGEVGGDAVGDCADRQCEGEPDDGADADEAAVRDGPVVGREDDEGREGVRDEERARADEDAVRGDGPEHGREREVGEGAGEREPEGGVAVVEGHDAELLEVGFLGDGGVD